MALVRFPGTRLAHHFAQPLWQQTTKTYKKSLEWSTTLSVQGCGGILKVYLLSQNSPFNRAYVLRMCYDLGLLYIVTGAAKS